MDSVTSCTQGGWGYGKKKGKKRVCLLELVQFLLSFFGQNSNNSLKADLLLRLAAASGGRGNCGRHRQQLMMKSGLLEWEPCYRKCHWKYCWPWQIKYRVSQLNYIRCVTHRRGRAGGFFNNGPWVINTLVLLCLRDLFFFADICLRSSLVTHGLCQDDQEVNPRLVWSHDSSQVKVMNFLPLPLTLPTQRNSDFL